MKQLVVMLCVALVVGCGPGSDITDLTTAQWNLYVGTEFTPVMVALLQGSEEDVPVAVNQVWKQMLATDFPTRAEAIADEIARLEPDLVGLQEAALWRRGPYDPETPAVEVVQDFVRILLDALAARGLHYEVVASFDGMDLELPRLTDSYELEDVRITDREVILARPRRGVFVSNPRSGAYAVTWGLPPYVEIVRGWVSVDVWIRGRDLRFFSTHLEAEDEDVRLAQAAELFSVTAEVEVPVVVVGDLNFDLNAPTEGTQTFLGLMETSGLEVAGGPGAGAATCCADEFLVDPFVGMVERLDLVLHGGDFPATEPVALCTGPDAMVDGLWPSDHAGVTVHFDVR